MHRIFLKLFLLVYGFTSLMTCLEGLENLSITWFTKSMIAQEYFATTWGCSVVFLICTLQEFWASQTRKPGKQQGEMDFMWKFVLSAPSLRPGIGVDLNSSSKCLKYKIGFVILICLNCSNSGKASHYVRVTHIGRQFQKQQPY